MDNTFSQEQINELKEIFKKYSNLPNDIELECLTNQSSNIAYIFPIEEDKPVKMVFEGETISIDDESLQLFYKKIKENINES